VQDAGERVAHASGRPVVAFGQLRTEVSGEFEEKGSYPLFEFVEEGFLT
jgi:hypothetical protein